MESFLLANPGLAIAVVIALGAASQWLAWRASLPAILPLLIVGFAVGPLLGWLHPSSLIGEDLLFPAIGLAVGLILFEGGLTLSIPEVKETRRVLINMVTVGAVITWLGGAAAAFFLTDLSLQLSFLFGALIIVTGPTVIGPLLRIVRPNAHVANLLKWEGILIDAIGAMVAVLVFEFILIENREQALGQTLTLFLTFLAVGTLVGALGGVSLATILRRRWVPDYLVNVVALSFVFGGFAAANALAPEAGLLATVLMGAIVANMGVPGIGDLLSFKEDLTILFISLLFIVLAANIELTAFLDALSLGTLALIAIVMLVLRPLNIFASSIGSTLALREKLYLSWIAPRGIVAAAVSSLFASKLISSGYEGAEALAPLVFLVIVGTVLANSLTAKPLGVFLKVAEPDPQGFLILGAHPIARRIGHFLDQEGLPVLLSDTNWSNVASARVEGLRAYYGSLLSEHADDQLRLSGIGRLLALTSNDEANALTALRFARDFSSQNVFQLEPTRTSGEREGMSDEQRGRIVFHEGTTYRELERLFAAGAVIKKTSITEQFDLDDFAERYDRGYLPLFAIANNKIRVLTEDAPLPEPGAMLVAFVLETSDEKVGEATAVAG